MDYNHIAKIVGVLPDFLFLPVLYIIRYKFYKKILGFKNNICIYIFVSLLLTLFDVLTMNSMSKALLTIFNNVLLLLAIHLLCKGNIIIKLYTVIIENTIFLLVGLITLPFDFWISPIINSISMSFRIHMILNFIHIGIYDILIYTILYIILSKISNYLNFKDKSINLSQGLYLLLPSFSSYGLASIIYFIQEVKISNEVYYLPNLSSTTYCVFLPFVSALFLISIPIVAYSFKKLIESDKQKRKSMLIEQQFELQLNHMKNVDGIYLGIRKVIHDMNNHITCLKNLADNNNNKEIKEYLHNLSETVNKLDFRIRTGNPICDAVINEKFSIAQNERVEFISDFIIPKNTSLEPVDLCVILGNALDNSIEACRKITNPNIEKKISIKSFVRQFYLIIEITNTSMESLNHVDHIIISTKPDKINHGIGLANINDVVKKYNGIIDIVKDKNDFTLTIMLKIH